MPKAYSYLRFSTPEQSQGDSQRRQTQLAVDYCARHGLTLDTSVTYADLGVSAFRGKNADTGRLAEFLEAVRAGIVEPGSYLLVESLDRVSRQAARKALRVLEDICEAGVVVVTLVDGKQYTEQNLTDDPMSLIMSLLIFIRANEESVTKSRRLKAAWVGKRLKIVDGHKLTARCPGWLRYDKETNQFHLIKERAAVIERIFKEYVRGFGPHTIAEHLNEAKIPVFGDGTAWHRSYIVKLIDESPAVVGTYVPKIIEFVNGKKVRKPQEPIPGYFPAAISHELYQQVRSMRSKTNAPLRGKAVTVHNIFGGLVHCARCGGAMHLQNKGSIKRKGSEGWRYLVCTKARYGDGCKYTAVRYDQIEESFLQDHLRLLGLTPAANGELDADLERTLAAMDALESRRANLLTALERTGDQSITERLVPINEELGLTKEKVRELRDLVEASAGALVERRVKDLKKVLQPLDRTQANAMIRALFSGLSINPDTGVATLGWKHGGSSEFTWGFPSAEEVA